MTRMRQEDVLLAWWLDTLTCGGRRMGTQSELSGVNNHYVRYVAMEEIAWLTQQNTGFDWAIKIQV